MWFETPKAFVEFKEAFKEAFVEFKEVFRGRSRAQVVSFCVLLGLIIMGITFNIK